MESVQSDPAHPEREESASGKSAALQEQLLSLPILYKVLIANALIVLAGAVFGTYVTARFVHEDIVPRREGLMLLFGGLGVVLSLAVNYWVLRVAFEPLDSLERVASAVRHGDFSARTEPWRFGDPQLSRFADTFNETLDELQQDREQIQSLADQVIQAQEEERRRISRELHDDTAQVLFAQLLRVTALKHSSDPELRATAEELEDLTVEAIESVRRLALELRPPALDDLGLHDALADLAQRFEAQLAIPISLKMSGARGRLASEVELVLYRVAQEALTNAGKHARATRIVLELVRSDTEVTMRIEDDGRGFDTALAWARDGRGIGLGLFGMEERVGLVGGTLSIDRMDPHGTRVAARIPLSGDTPALSGASRRRRALDVS
ncbi:MAG TPA: sensor histidine kinase [Thermomicrobiales bacterium]|nr:sensor histidine kinase [Thermomicrobiales bacterium]